MTGLEIPERHRRYLAGAVRGGQAGDVLVLVEIERDGSSSILSFSAAADVVEDLIRRLRPWIPKASSWSRYRLAAPTTEGETDGSR